MDMEKDNLEDMNDESFVNSLMSNKTKEGLAVAIGGLAIVTIGKIVHDVVSSLK